MKSRITDDQAQDILNRYLNGERGDYLAAEYKVSKQTISNFLLVGIPN